MLFFAALGTYSEEDLSIFEAAVVSYNEEVIRFFDFHLM